MIDTHQFQDIVDPVTPQVLRELADLPAPVVSLYVPTARSRPASERSPLELRALADEAQARLIADGASEQDALTLLAPVRELQQDPVVWSEQADGLALFASPRGLRTFRLPQPVEALCVVGEVAHLVPLVSLAAGDDRYVVLALSQRRVQLFDATPTGIAALTLGDIPADIDDVERRNVRQAQLQHQHQPRGGGGGQTAGHHGHSSAGDVSDVQVEKFVREVAVGVRERVGSHAAPPIVLAAVAEYLPKLRETGLLPTLQEEIVPGNPDTTPPEELLERSRPIALARLDADRQERRARAEELVGTGRATVDPGAVLTAAREGRAAELLVDPAAGGVTGQAGDSHSGGPDSALDDAVAAALLTGAELHHVSGLPDGARLAALLRY